MPDWMEQQGAGAAPGFCLSAPSGTDAPVGDANLPFDMTTIWPPALRFERPGRKFAMQRCRTMACGNRLARRASRRARYRHSGRHASICPDRAAMPRGNSAKAHIPGALFFDIEEISDSASPLPHMLPSPEKFSSRVRKMGIGDGMRVVVYDQTNMSGAARAWWMFRVMGVQRCRRAEWRLRQMAGRGPHRSRAARRADAPSAISPRE